MKTKTIKLRFTTPDGVVSKSTLIDIPEKMTDLINDGGFITETDILEGKVFRGRTMWTTEEPLSTSGGTVSSSKIITPDNITSLIEGDLILDINGSVAKISAVSSSDVTYEYFTTLKGEPGATPILSINNKGELIASY